MRQSHVTPRAVALGLAGAGLLIILIGTGRSDQLVAVGLVFCGLAVLLDWLYGGQRQPYRGADPGLRLTPVGRRVIIIGVTLVLAVAAGLGVGYALRGGW